MGDVALRVYRIDDENGIRAITRFHKRALESIKDWRAGSSVHVKSRKQMKKVSLKLSFFTYSQGCSLLDFDIQWDYNLLLL